VDLRSVRVEHHSADGPLDRRDQDVTLDGLSQTRHHAQACVVYGYRFWIIAGKHDRRDQYSSGEEIVLQLDACHRGHVGINQQAIGVWAAVVERGEELMA
jgi:hypothetical protein